MSGHDGFAVWITGLPGSGKSTITRELAARLKAEGLHPAVLESDAMRMVLTPEPTYRTDERDRFYLQLAQIGEVLVKQGIPVILDATANRRAYRDHARAHISRFVEVFVQCTIDLCRERDPKGIYGAADRGVISNVPGVHAAYEEPLAAEVIIDCREVPAIGAGKIISHLKRLRYI